MPRLRRLNGAEVVRIFEQLGFEVIRIRGSHHIIRRTINNETQTMNIPAHGSQQVALGTLKRIYRDAQRYVTEADLKSHFYSD